jgi:hypothetical protein
MRWFIIVSLGLLFGIIPSIWIVQNNRSAKKIILSSLISYLEEKWNAQIIVEKSNINLFAGIIDLDRLQIISNNNPKCIWTCKKGRLHILQRQSLIDNKVTLKIELNDNNIETEYKNKELGLVKLLQSIFKIQSKYFRPKAFEINGINLSIKEAIQLHLDGSLVIKNDQTGLWRGRLQVAHGEILKDGIPLLKNLTGSSFFHQTNDENLPMEININQQFTIPVLHKTKPHVLAGTWNSIKKSFCFLQPNDTSLSLTPTNNALFLSGAVSLLKNTQLQIKINTTPTIGFSGTIVHQKPIPLFGYYYIPAKKFYAIVAEKLSDNLLGTYHATVAHKHTTDTYETNGTFSVDAPYIHLTGTSPYGDYKAILDLSKKKIFSLDMIQKNKHGAMPVVTMKQKQPGSLQGTMRYAFLQSLLPISLQRWLLGNKGNISVNISSYNPKKIEGEISLSSGKIYIPGFYNIITNFRSKFFLNIEQRRLTLYDTVVTLQKGTIECRKATIHWNEDGEISFIHTYVQAKNVMVNWKNDFFAFIDYNTFVTMDTTSSPLRIAGDVIIKKSLLKENIFSNLATTHNTRSVLTKENIELDINIFSEEDLLIKTPLISAQATTNLHLKLKQKPQQLSSPRLSGSVTLRKGELLFPKNKLLISSGKIKCLPTQPNNPMIHLTARNRIKKYNISLYISGPLQSPTIILESNPELTEEQIIALLFAGSETISLRSDLPAIIMQNLSTLILGNKKFLSRSTNFFKTLTTPLKYIQITPNFTDQTGRGGVKATIAIDVNKQLHAYIQKNFSTQDDLAFQVEYFLSDNINIKAIKDHRGDIGAEVEFSFCSLS